MMMNSSLVTRGIDLSARSSRVATTGSLLANSSDAKKQSAPRWPPTKIHILNNEALNTVYWTQVFRTGWLGGVVVKMSDLILAVVGSNPGHGIAGFF